MTRICEFEGSPLHENRVKTDNNRQCPIRIGSLCQRENSSSHRDRLIRSRSELSSESGVTFQSSRKVTPTESNHNHHQETRLVSPSTVSNCPQIPDPVSKYFTPVKDSRYPGSTQTNVRSGDGDNNGSKVDAAPKLAVSRKRKRRSSSNEISRKRRYEDNGCRSDDSGCGDSKMEIDDTQCMVDDKDGYLIMTPGKYIKDYKILNIIGEGAFGRVAECSTKTSKTVALKVVKSAHRYSKSAKLEMKVIKTLMQLDPTGLFSFVTMLDSFKHVKHQCIVFEKLGSNLYDFQKANKYAPYPPCHVQVIAYQLISAVNFMHDHKLIHTDLKPENILFVDSEFDEVKDKASGSIVRVLRNPRIRIIDFGSSTYEDDYHSRIISTRHYRAPEVILELKWSYPCDVWSIGCILFEAFSGVALFMTHDNMEHLAMIERALGQGLSRRLVRNTKKRRYFYHGRLDWNVHSKMGRYVRDHTRHISRYFDDNTRSERHLYRLTRDLLACHPNDRISLRSALRHRYFDDDVLDNRTLREIKDRKSSDSN